MKATDELHLQRKQYLLLIVNWFQTISIVLYRKSFLLFIWLLRFINLTLFQSLFSIKYLEKLYLLSGLNNLQMNENKVNQIFNRTF